MEERCVLLLPSEGIYRGPGQEELRVAQSPGPRQSRVIRLVKIPLNLPLLKGDFKLPHFGKGGRRGDFKKERFSERIQESNADYDVTLAQSLKSVDTSL